MTIRSRVYLECDAGCGTTLRSDDPGGAMQVQGKADMKGWRTVVLHYSGTCAHFCPACAAGKTMTPLTEVLRKLQDVARLARKAASERETDLAPLRNRVSVWPFLRALTESLRIARDEAMLCKCDELAKNVQALADDLQQFLLDDTEMV